MLQMTTEAELAKDIRAQLELLHEKALPLCSEPDETCGREQLGANGQTAPTVVEVSSPTTMAQVQMSSVHNQDTSLALQYIDSIKGLRDEVAEREKECAEAAQEKKQLQVLSPLNSADGHALLFCNTHVPCAAADRMCTLYRCSTIWYQ